MTTSTTSKRRLKTDQYAKDVVAGKIVACKKVIQACQRHLDDLERSKKKDYPYTFDYAKAYRPIEFLERNCKPSQGRFKTIELQPWDHFVIGSLFGWVTKKTRFRRFRFALIFVGRKNGKTIKASGLSLFTVSKDDEDGARVYQLANALKQARLTYDECRTMVKKEPRLAKRFRSLRDAIYYDKTDSKIEPLASDSENLDGLNCHFGVFDEIHEYKDYSLISVIEESTGTRVQPLIINITTAGFVLDGPLVDYYEHAADVLDGVVEDERSFYYIAELDDEKEIEDPDTWVKANPNIGFSLNLEEMKESWQQRKRAPQTRNSFITKRLNFFVKKEEQSFIDYATLKKNKGVIDIAVLKGRTCVGGFDLSMTEDFTAACLEFPLDDGRVFILEKSFIPERKVLLDNEKLPFRAWEKAGWLGICPGLYVDYQRVYDWFIEMSKLYSISVITYDPANALRLVEEFKAYGGEDWVKLVRQGAITLSPALKDFKELLLDGKVVSNNNKLFIWYLNNVKLVDDRNKNWMPTKQGRYKKIDGFAAALNAHTVAMKLMTEMKETGTVSFISRKELMGE